MDRVSVTFQVFFSDPFWIGIADRVTGQKQETARMVFGAEPKDYEVEEILLKHYERLRFSPAVEAKVKERHGNPKKMQRDIKKQVLNTGLGTKSQQALKLMQEEHKLLKKQKSREQKELENRLQFERKQQKRKEKHRGR